jgi:HEPN/RES N-terminal domain 1/RES domain
VGHFSDLAIMMTERRIRPEGAHGRRVCSACFADPYLVREVERHADGNACHYCGANGKAVRAAPLEHLVEYMLRQIDIEYASADQSLPNDPETKGRMFPEDEFETVELLENYIELELPKDDGTLISDIVATLPEQDWCLLNPLGTQLDEAIGNSWESFKQVIKHRRRFFFLAQPDRALERDFAWGEAAYDIPELLERIAAFTKTHGMLMPMPAGKAWIRCQRMHEGERNFGPRRMGPPPYDLANLPNRMSPAGVPMFYGADTRETALAEVADEHGRFAVGRFEIQRDAIVLDARAAPPVPSLFDAERARDRPIAVFIHSFIADFRAPIDRKRSPHVDYLPTQIITEYFRTMVLVGKVPIDGVVYASTKGGGDAVVLFAENEDVVEDGADADDLHDPWLVMTGYEELTFDPSTGAVEAG